MPTPDQFDARPTLLDLALEVGMSRRDLAQLAREGRVVEGSYPGVMPVALLGEGSSEHVIFEAVVATVNGVPFTVLQDPRR